MSAFRAKVPVPFSRHAWVPFLVAFLVGFYPFPAGLMIYWIMNNLLQLPQQILARR